MSLHIQSSVKGNTLTTNSNTSTEHQWVCMSLHIQSSVKGNTLTTNSNTSTEHQSACLYILRVRPQSRATLLLLILLQSISQSACLDTSRAQSRATLLLRILLQSIKHFAFFFQTKLTYCCHEKRETLIFKYLHTTTLLKIVQQHWWKLAGFFFLFYLSQDLLASLKTESSLAIHLFKDVCLTVLFSTVSCSVWLDQAKNQCNLLTRTLDV